MIFDVYAIVDPLAAGVIDRALGLIAIAPAGRLAIQVRSKGQSAEVHAAAIEALREPARLSDVSLFVNGHVALAAALDVGVHLPEDGPEISEVRRQVRRIGVSCHDAGGLSRRRGADFAVLGPVGVVPSKGAPLSWPDFAALSRDAPMPVYALGGITDAADVRRAREHGARGVAAQRALAGDDAGARLVDLLSGF